MVEDDGTILRAGVVALAVQRGGIVRLPECLDDFLVGGFCGIEFDLDDLCVASVAPADVFVGGVLGLAA